MSVMGEDVTEEEAAFHFYVSAKLGCRICELADMEDCIRAAKKIASRVETTDDNRIMQQYMERLYESSLALIGLHNEIMKAVAAMQKWQANAQGETIN